MHVLALRRVWLIETPARSVGRFESDLFSLKHGGQTHAASNSAGRSSADLHGVYPFKGPIRWDTWLRYVFPVTHKRNRYCILRIRYRATEGVPRVTGSRSTPQTLKNCARIATRLNPPDSGDKTHPCSRSAVADRRRLLPRTRPDNRISRSALAFVLGISFGRCQPERFKVAQTFLTPNLVQRSSYSAPNENVYSGLYPGTGGNSYPFSGVARLIYWKIRGKYCW